MCLPENYFHKNFHILAREAHLIAEIFYSGLTQLRNSSSSNVGKAYVGFFNLSIGIERICKLIIIADHMVNNESRAPTKQQIRGYGHKITDLVTQAVAISKRYDRQVIEDINEDIITWKLLEFLGKFAGTVRYENIDGLCDDTIDVDHMKKWRALLEVIIQEEVSDESIAKERGRADAIRAAFGDNVSYMNFGYDDRRLPDGEVFFTQAVEQKAIARAVRHLNLLIEKLCLLGWEIGSHAIAEGQRHFPEQAVFPELGDFFRGVLTYGQNLLKKKRWQAP